MRHLINIGDLQYKRFPLFELLPVFHVITLEIFDIKSRNLRCDVHFVRQDTPKFDRTSFFKVISVLQHCMQGKAHKKTQMSRLKRSHNQNCTISRVETKRTDQNWELHWSDRWDPVVTHKTIQNPTSPILQLKSKFVLISLSPSSFSCALRIPWLYLVEQPNLCGF